MANAVGQKPRRTPRMRRIELVSGEDLYKLLFRLYYVEDLTLAEISAKLGVPLGTLGTWMVRLGLDRAQMARRAANGEGAA